METLTAAEIVKQGSTFGSKWQIIAAHYTNRWIAPGEVLAVVGHTGGLLAPLSPLASGKTPIEQVRDNLPYYAEGWLVSRTGAVRVLPAPAAKADVA